ncbi:MAG: DJ-1/PfpI family protein [Candidatus Eremiobacteraeota bacterium]|nr:DJ-1/PfpI family protein [Candidatus Eremiobacteraeota bacterium]MBV8498166.1 DJ-1/PfpI family protein [Candidatus Eremiobacteraeota bacterium]
MNRKDAIVIGSTMLAGAVLPRRALAQAPAVPSAAVRVAFVVGPFSNLIDVAGPYEVFADMYASKSGGPPPDGADNFGDDKDAHPLYAPYLVSDTLEPIKAGRGVVIVPDYTFVSAPSPGVIVMGAQSRHSPQKLEWIREMARTAEVVMSVCTGAYVLAGTGLLDGKRATTHHDYYDDFAATFPKVHVVRGPRYVEEGKFKTAGGLTSGIELAIRVIALMHGERRADLIAHYIEYVRTERPA